MIREFDKDCPDCGDILHPYGSAKRLLRGKNGVSTMIIIKRYKCNTCNRIHNLLPYSVTPFIRYDNEVVMGVLEGYISSDTLGFENYPCEPTMLRWRNNLQILTEIVTTV